MVVVIGVIIIVCLAVALHEKGQLVKYQREIIANQARQIDVQEETIERQKAMGFTFSNN